MRDQSSAKRASSKRYQPSVKRTNSKRYQWPPEQDKSLADESSVRNPIHSILTALPIIMLVAGLYIYYQAESQQNDGVPIIAQSQTLSGQFTGLSVVPSGATPQHYFWIEQDGKATGLRIKAEEAEKLESLDRGIQVIVQAAPTVEGSHKLWIWQLLVNSEIVINNQPL